MDCPQLIDAQLVTRSYPRFLSRSKWVSTGQNRFPQLAVLRITYRSPFSLDSLYLLDMFKHSPVQRLEIWGVGSPTQRESTTSGSTKTVMNILSHFQPELVRIDAASLKSILAILGGIKGHNIRRASLYINFENGTPSNSSYRARGPSPFKLGRQVPQTINFPFLHTLGVNGVTPVQLHDLLQQMNAEAMAHLDLYLSPDSSNSTIIKTWEKGKPLPSFVSLSSLTIEGSILEQRYSKNSFLRKLWEMSPKLTRLKLVQAGSGSSTLPNLCEFLFSSLDPVQSSPSEQEIPISLPLPSLSYLHATCPVVIPESAIVTESDVEELRLATIKRLVSRHEKGAVSLELVEFDYDNNAKVFRFCATQCHMDA